MKRPLLFVLLALLAPAARATSSYWDIIPSTWTTDAGAALDKPVALKGPRPFADVMAYGAKGDGVQDDGNAITAAYNAVKNLGGILFFPYGTFKTSQSISPAAHVVIKGTNKRSTIINYTGTAAWLDDTSTGTVKQDFTLSNMTVNAATTSVGAIRIGDVTQTAFSENNQRVDYEFDHIILQGNTGAIHAGSVGMQLATFIRAKIDDVLIFDFDTSIEWKKFDEARVSHLRLQRFLSQAIYWHNDMTGGGGHVADETLLEDNKIEEVPATSTAAINLLSVENFRFLATYVEPASGDHINAAFKASAVYNGTFDGFTVSIATTLFSLTNVRSFNILHGGLQNPETSPLPTNTVSFIYSGTDASGTGGPFANSGYGLVTVRDCQPAIQESFKGIPGVDVVGPGRLGAGEAHYGGAISDVSNLYAAQVLDRGGSAPNQLRETAVVINAFSANKYLNGSVPTGFQVVADTNATGGYAIKSPASNLFMDVPFTELPAGAYEIVARIRTGAAVAGNFLGVYSNGGAIQENYAGVNTTTNYQTVVARFNLMQNISGSTVSVRIGDGTQDLYVDYVILRPCFNRLALQKFVPSDFQVYGSSSTPGYNVVYTTAAPGVGNWTQGDLAINTAPAVNGNQGWVCTVSGNPGTWSVWGIVGHSLSSNNTWTGTNTFKGNTDGGTPAAGNWAEVLSSTTASGSTTNNTYVNIAAVTLSAGSWQVIGELQADSTTTVTRSLCAVSAFSGNTTTDHVSGDNVFDGALPVSGANGSCPAIIQFVNTSGSKVMYLKSRLSFGSGSPTATGTLRAVRLPY